MSEPKFPRASASSRRVSGALNLAVGFTHGIYTSSGFPESHHRQVVDGSIPTYRTHKNTPESHHRQVVDGSIPTCELNNGKQGLGLNHPPPAGGGIPGSFPVLVGWD